MATRAATVGLIKGPGPAIYWYASNGKRYVFPTWGTYWSWYGFDQQRIQELTPQELGAIPLGGNVTYKPGVRLLKITTDPKVYAVSRGAVLHWVESEALAKELYGNEWMRRIHDLPDEFFANYTMGDSVGSASDFDPAGETRSVNAPEDNFPPAATNISRETSAPTTE